MVGSGTLFHEGGIFEICNSDLYKWRLHFSGFNISSRTRGKQDGNPIREGWPAIGTRVLVLQPV